MDVGKRQPQRQLRWARTASLLFLVSALVLSAVIRFLRVKTFEGSGLRGMLFTTGECPEETVLFLVANHVMPPAQGRLHDMVARYQASFARYPNIDFKYVWTNNFQGTDPEDSIDDSIMTFAADEVRYLKSICPYCAGNPWNWSNYASVVLATRQLMQKGIKYDKVWFAEPDAEFVGDIGEWVSLSTKSFGSLDLVSSLIFYDLKTATEVLPSAGMFARIQSNWRQHKGIPLRWGAFTQTTCSPRDLSEPSRTIFTRQSMSNCSSHWFVNSFFRLAG